MSSILENYLNESVFILGLVMTVAFIVVYFTKLKSKQLLNYLPNIWTSLGILGTFIAIVYSLNDLQEQSKTQENKTDEYIIEPTNQIISLNDSKRDDKKNTEINEFQATRRALRCNAVRLFSYLLHIHKIYNGTPLSTFT